MAKDTKIVSLFDRNRVNYAKLLLDFLKPVEGEYEGVELLEIGISAWNTSNMMAEMPENFVDPQLTAAHAGAPEDVLEVLEFLIKRKKKYFAEYDLFIYDFEVLDKTKEISVQTMPLEEYIVAVQKTMEEGMPDDMFEGIFDDDFDDEEGMNKEAIFIKSKAPVCKYLVKRNEYMEERDGEFLPTKIITFYNEFIDFDAWLDENYKKVMESVLSDYLMEDELPKQFSLKKFKTWFDYQFVESVDEFEAWE